MTLESLILFFLFHIHCIRRWNILIILYTNFVVFVTSQAGRHIYVGAQGNSISGIVIFLFFSFDLSMQNISLYQTLVYYLIILCIGPYNLHAPRSVESNCPLLTFDQIELDYSRWYSESRLFNFIFYLSYPIIWRDWRKIPCAEWILDTLRRLFPISLKKLHNYNPLSAF
jgi:hypothetical protein